MLDVSTEKEYRFNGEGYVAVNSTESLKMKTSILMSFKTYAEDGLMFVAYGSKNMAKRDTSDRNKISIEMKGGHVLYQVSVLLKL